jgi:hypothetical protein
MKRYYCACCGTARAVRGKTTGPGRGLYLCTNCGPDAPPRYAWGEEYRCGCLSPLGPKRDLPGYCPTHGTDRRNVHRVRTPTTEEER